MEALSILHRQEPEGEGRRTLELTGKATIAQALQLKEALLAAVAAASELQLDLSGLTEVDLTALQLFCAAHRCACSAGKALVVTRGADKVSGAASTAGFYRQVGCPGNWSASCVWPGQVS